MTDGEALPILTPLSTPQIGLLRRTGLLVILALWDFAWKGHIWVVLRLSESAIALKVKALK